MKKTLIARNINQRLNAAENAVDASIAEVSRLMAAMVETRQDLGLPATLGAEALEKVGEALTALTAARSATVAAHHELARTADALGIPTTMMPHVPVGVPKVAGAPAPVQPVHIEQERLAG